MKIKKFFFQVVVKIQQQFGYVLEFRQVAEVPDKAKNHTLYLIGDSQAWQAALSCPCGCQTLIQLSLLEYETPSWKAVVDEFGRPSLHPSVWRTEGCRSHFFLKHGRVVWCRGR